MLRNAALASLVLTLAAPLASADEAYGPPMPAAAPAPAPPPPATDDWQNVSHINGQVVKVGERGDYLYNNGKTTNISADPFGVMFGYYDAAIEHAVSPNVVIAGSFTGWSFDSGNGYQGTVSAPIYFKRSFSGPFLEPGVIVRSSTDKTSNMTTQWEGAEVLFGWHYSFDSGLNVAWAFGLAKHISGDGSTSTTSDGSTSSSDSLDVNGYFRVGYAF